MGCGCKKNKQTTVGQPTQITVTTEQVPTQQNLTLTEEQQKTVDAIVAKLNQLNG